MRSFGYLMLGALALAVVLVLCSSSLPALYDGLFDGVTTMKTHTVYINGVPESQAAISVWRIKFPNDIPEISAGAVTFNDFDKDSGGRRGFYYRGLAAWLKEEKIVYNPTDNNKHDFEAEYFSIGIDNSLLEYRENPDLARKDYCLMPDDNIHPGPLRCAKDSPACPVYVNYHGWNASATVDHETLYITPQLVCKILKENLDKWTISIDDLRRPQQGELQISR